MLLFILVTFSDIIQPIFCQCDIIAEISVYLKCNNISGMEIQLSTYDELHYSDDKYKYFHIKSIQPDVTVNVDEVTELDLKNKSFYDNYYLKITNVKILPHQSYGELLSKLGLNSSSITSAWIIMDGLNDTITLKNLNGLPGVSYLWIVASDIKSIPEDLDFSQLFPKLNKLRIKSEDVQYLPNIVGLKSLSEIEFTIPNLEKLPEFDYENITSLKIFYSKEPQIQSYICDRMPKLNVLEYSFAGNAFPVFGNCSELQHVEITGSMENLDEISDELENDEKCLEMPNVTTVTFSYIRIQIITKRMFEKTLKLNALFLSHNGITHIEENAFGHSSDLQSVSILNNKILTVSDVIFPPSILQLVLSHNRLSGNFNLNNVSKNYLKLNFVDLSGNQLTGFIISGSLDVHIHHIDLTNNQIETIKVPDSSDFGRKKLTFRLENNKLKCDCDLKPFLKILQTEPSKVILDSESGIKNVDCDFPKGEDLKNIDLEKIKC